MRFPDAFFENVCELDLVFNFYKVCKESLLRVPRLIPTLGVRDIGRSLSCGGD